MPAGLSTAITWSSWCRIRTNRTLTDRRRGNGRPRFSEYFPRSVVAFLLALVAAGGPLGLRTQGPLRELFLDVTAADARPIDRGEVELRWSVANTWNEPMMLQRGGEWATQTMDEQADAVTLRLRTPWPGFPTVWSALGRMERCADRVVAPARRRLQLPALALCPKRGQAGLRRCERDRLRHPLLDAGARRPDRTHADPLDRGAGRGRGARGPEGALRLALDCGRLRRVRRRRGPGRDLAVLHCRHAARDRRR